MASHNELGHLGEELAASYLGMKGYEILERNWTSGKAEVDIIARKENVLAIIEVKARTSAEYGLPHEFVKKRKIRLLVAAVDTYVTENELDIEVRFDIVAVLFTNLEPEIEHLEDAFFYFDR